VLHIREQDVEHAKFATADHALDANQVGPLREQMKMTFNAILNHEICTKYVADGDVFIATAAWTDSFCQADSSVLSG
jgi:hypothetical protein